MKWHVLRPLWVAIGLIAVILTARVFLVPDDFGVHGDSFTYNFHRLGNEQDWKDFPVKYQGRDSCRECHTDNYRSVRRSSHKQLECENCHGPAYNHPDQVALLPRNTDRSLCLRCHAFLDYPNNVRNEMPQVDAAEHHPGQPCAECHNPHNPREIYE